ncbi:MAG: hypothetical protein HYX89_06350 [Chloroflexi bacterium]|nr:hypothetical protein [Chloroflexota bacterium]
MAGILLSNLYFMVALVLFHRLTERKLGAQAAQWATLFFAFFPFAFFFSAVYTEALFVLLAVAAFFFAERRQWLLASLAGMLCSATRLVGVSLFPALAVLYWQQWRSPKKEPLANAIYLSLIPAGLGAYMIFLQQRFGEPFAFLKANEAGWGARFSLEFPLHHDFWDFLTQILPTQGFRGDYDFGLLVNVVVTILFLVAIYPVARRAGLSYAVFAFFALAIPFSSALISLGRFAAVVFPVFMVAGDLLRGRPLLAQSVLMLSGLFMGLFTALFVNWYWMI